MYVSPSTGVEVKAVLFDTFGTVVDWRSGVARSIDQFSSEHNLPIDSFKFADEWRRRYEPSMTPVRDGSRGYAPLRELHMENLLATLESFEISVEDFTEDELDHLNCSWERLDPWTDSIPGLLALKKQYIISPLSNGNVGLLTRMAKNSQLPWDLIIGSDISLCYKPDRGAYVKAAELLELLPGEVMLAAAHNYDLAAAREAGLATAFIVRPTEHGPTQTIDLQPEQEWDHCVDSITALAVGMN